MTKRSRIRDIPGSTGVLFDQGGMVRGLFTTRSATHDSTRWVLAGLLAGWLALAPSPAQAEDLRHEAGLGVAAAVVSLFYGPVKIIYAGLGGLVAGGAWAISGGDAEVVAPIINAALRGDYVVTPSHLLGERELQFVGRDPRHHNLASGPVFDDGF